MGCCQTTEPMPPTHVKGAFSDYMEKNEHNSGEVKFNKNNSNSMQKNSTKSSFYQSRSTNIKSTASAELTHLHPSSRSNSTDHSHNSTKQLLKNNKKSKASTRTQHAVSNPLPFKKQTFDSNLAPNVSPPQGPHMQSKAKISLQSNTEGDTEREYSISKSQGSRAFRRRPEPKSPDSHHGNAMNEPPPIYEGDDESSDDNASSLSDDVEIPGLKPIVFSDEDHIEADDEDENLKIMQLLVQEENERLEHEIARMKDHIYEQETIKMKRDAMQSIMEEMATQHKKMEEEEKRKKAMERYDKMQKKREKEREEEKERRRKKKEMKEKKRKALLMKRKMQERQKAREKKRDQARKERQKEMETYAVPEKELTQEEIVDMFDKYFLANFEAKAKKKKKDSLSDMTDDSDTDTSSDEEEIREGCVDFDGFKAGLTNLGINLILSRAEIEMLFDHIGHSQIDAVVFRLFMKTNPITLDPKMVIIHKKVLATLAKQQDKEDNERRTQTPVRIQISGPVMTPPVIRVDVDDDEEEQTPTGDIPETPTQQDFDATSPDFPKSRDDSVSITESSMTMDYARIGIPSNIPRKSFKQINYNWNDTISSNSLNNYKRLKQKFGMKYYNRRQHNQTKDRELEQIQDKLMKEKSLKDIHDEDDDDNKEEEHMTITVDEVQRGDNNGVLPGIDETKEHDDIVHDIEDHDIDKAPRRSAVGSLKRIQEYEGNDKMTSLRNLYKRQHKMRQKLERLRKRSLLNFPTPEKPRRIEMFLDEKTRYICKELKQCICKNTRYTGLANFGPNGELGIELEFTTDCDDDGYICGKRILSFRNMKQSKGKGRIWMDVAWNGHKWLPCTRFEWLDEGEGVATKFEFDSVGHEIDVDHSFFQGKCTRYPSDLDPELKTTQIIMHEGFFDFVCVSARRRSIRKNSLFDYHTLDVNELDETQLQKVPKYVRRMSAYADKMDKLYQNEAPANRDTLFGEAIAVLPQGINDSARDTKAGSSIPEQINE